MADKTISESSETLPAAPAAFDLNTAAWLGAKAEGVEIAALTNTAKHPGLPDAVPVLLRRGTSPGIESLATLFEPYRQFPVRKAGQAVAQTFEAFTNLTLRHQTEHSAIFANMDWKKPTLTTIVDYHELAAGHPNFGKHRVHYAFPLSDEWQKWVAGDGEKMDQGAFAWFLEDRVAELSSPTDEEKLQYERDFATTIATPAQLVELSRGLQVNVESKVKASTTLQSGEGQIAWEESHNGVDGKPLKVPGIFMLNIAPFFMGDKVRIPVRLRYRPAGGKVTWFYQIYRPDQFITQHVRDVLAEARRVTNLPTFEGTPEMAA
ncbi:DUF2303 family protein [Mesorhizobium sp. B2-5-9]|uniref:DUF2303 family protein n=1 Tax=Mesorhizobium sp. B2-5-9 TaxID=2589921 RepID=UPI0011260323|nr:DUF2303 family protein [Mesorhizobium sp. B2-5-9]TPK15208.1 DUF2303 family protein [Mesorhizobium sp. B2-5-9]